ncbi:60S ribosome subunit biogenesis protein NIP7 homolog [Nilaparvata lugens]|uniref:60S ribosome subunit biogenesis protein NIP7 homolog n=1 Tax=Nilaparvata lugens TaxID=108931 RepID=UPI00193EBF35|nr:60S ribosome subunit biogenesis protein NIP7 homolog [Nilaparvata lugens]
MPITLLKDRLFGILIDKIILLHVKKIFTFQFKIWVKPSAEQQFLYGHNVNKAGLGRITESTPKYQNVVVFSMSDLPLGFGVAARSTAECKHADPLATVCFHQADIGEYIRNEEGLL